MPTSFTAHNIILDDGSQTFPSIGWTLDRSPHVTVIHRLMNLLYPDGVAGRTIVDLGCLEGGFATEFARLGLESTGIEVRASNFENCQHIKQRVDLPNLRFIKDDAWNVGSYGPFDAIFCVGLFYHIDKVTDFMGRLSRNCRRLLFLDTHFAPDEDASPSIANHALSPLVTHEGLRGRWFQEHDLETSDQGLDQMKWASWENKTSFWPTRGALMDLMRSTGFDLIFESYEQLGGDLAGALGPTGYATTHSRGVFVGIKTEK